jgi:hypothetical protein
MDQHSHVQAKIIKFSTIREGLNYMKRWISKNLDSLAELPQPSEGERRVDYVEITDTTERGGESVVFELKQF